MRYKIAIFLFLVSTVLNAQSITQLQFRNQPIRDILMVLAEVSGQSIVADETVNGDATYFFNDMDLDEALDQFLTHYGYFYEKIDSTYHVSRIYIEKDNDLITLKAEDTDIQYVIRYLSRKVGITILHDALPRETVTINYENGNLEELLDIIIKPFPQFFLVAEENYFYIRKEDVAISSSSSRGNFSNTFFSRTDNLYSANFTQTRFREALSSLMEMEEKEFSYLGRNDNVIEYFNHNSKTFDEILHLLMEQGNATFHQSGDIYYILDIDRQDILRQYITTLTIQLQYISVDRLNSLMPSSLGSSSIMKIDSETNSVILSGTLLEITPVESFINELDKPLDNQAYRNYNLQYISVEEFTKRLSPEMTSFSIITLDEKTFLTALSEEKHQDLLSYIDMIDTEPEIYSITLKYLKWDELESKLPPTINKEQINPTGDPSLIFFEGSEGEYNVFLDLLAIMDAPTPQIRYEILVLQIEETKGLDLEANFSIGRDNGSTSTGFGGGIGNTASIGVDVVSIYGYSFSANLSASLSGNKSRVLADTTLHGLSGENIRFQNTKTSRHPTTTINPDTGDAEVTGFTEVTSGLIIDMEGWISGDGMITMNVQSTISSSSDYSGNSIPSTSEKVINTHVRSASGIPIVLSGLREQTTIISRDGWLQRGETLVNTEFIITIIPFREDDEIVIQEVLLSDIYNDYCVR